MVEQVPHGAAGFFQLGRIARLLNRPAEAAGYYAEALALDPLLWQAYEELCSLGARSSVPPRQGIGSECIACSGGSMPRRWRQQRLTLRGRRRCQVCNPASGSKQ